MKGAVQIFALSFVSISGSQEKCVVRNILTKMVNSLLLWLDLEKINLPKLSLEMVQPVANLFLKAKILQLPLFFHFRLGKLFHSLMQSEKLEAEPKSDEIPMLIKKVSLHQSNCQIDEPSKVKETFNEDTTTIEEETLPVD